MIRNLQNRKADNHDLWGVMTLSKALDVLRRNQ